MKKPYVIVAGIVIALPLIYFLHQQAQKPHQRELKAYTEKLEQIRADADKLPSVDLYPFPEHRSMYDWVSEFEGGLAIFYETRKGREKSGFVDFNNNIVLEDYGPVVVDTFPGFKKGRTQTFV